MAVSESDGKVMDKTESDRTNDKMSEKSLETNAEEKDEEVVSNGIAKTADASTEEKEPMDISEESSDNKSPKDDKSTKNSPAQSSGVKKRSSRSRSSRSSRSSSVDKPVEKEKIKEETTAKVKEETTAEVKEEKEAEFVKPKDESMSAGDFPGFESSPVPDLKKEQYIKLLRVSLGRDHDDEAMSQGANSDQMSIDNPPSVDSDNFTMGEGAPRRSTRAKKSLNVDMSSPEFRKPFDFGWTRELVYRSMHEGERTRRNADVYYYNSAGKKFRSYRDLHDYLSDGLEEKNFTFFKEPIGINDPTKEIIRGAKAKPPAKAPTEESAQKKPATPKLKPKPAPKSETPKTMPKVVFYKNNSNKNKNLSNKANLYKKRKSAGPDDVDAMSDTDWSPEQKHPTLDVCSIECRRAMGLIPNLQCSKCLCLYHKECMVVAQDKISKTNYICKNCQITKPTNSSVTPPLSTSSPTKSTPKATSPVKKEFKMVSRTQPIVGALTTWLPPSSSIQVANSQNTKTNTVVSSSAAATTTSSTSSTSPSKPVSPQGLVSMNGNSFILIQKHNVVNVSDQNTVAQNPPYADSVPTSPVVSQPQIGKTPLFLVPYQVPPPDSVDSAQFPSSIQAVPVLPTGSSQNGVKRPSDSDLSPPPEKKFKQIAMRNTSTELKENFMMNLNAGFTALLHAFQYLKVHELLRAVCVSQMWRHIASHRSLWETVRMKNSRVRDWDGFGQALRYHCTKNLDLRKMLLPETQEQTNQMWEEFGKAVAGLTHLKRIDFGRCTSQAIEIVAESNPQLESIVTLSLRSSEIDFKSIGNCVNLVELKLKSASGIEIKDLSALKNLKQLKVLALTTVKNLEGIEDALSESIENLELGDCTKFTQYFATDALPKLKNLKRLRLEKGQGTCPTIPILDAISDLPNLTQLELINFDIKPGFDTSLARCSNLKTLLIIPTYVTQSATTNHVVMGGVSKLSQSLTYFIWGLTLELLRVTDLFIDQVEGSKSKVANSSPGVKKASGDSIPILKPMTDVNEAKEGQSASQVDILGLPKLQRVLSTILPTTKIKILKVPFSATWRQTVTDSSSQ